MRFSVFYAWQSDRPNGVNRSFIQAAAQAAIDNVQADASIEESPRLDHDTKDVPGTPDIAETIFRKIDGCGLFVADLTFVGKSEGDADDPDQRLIPNPNVLLELGRATRSVGWDRILLVMNVAFGSADALPFDLRHRRRPIQYRLAPADADRPGVRNKLAKELEQALRSAIDSGVVQAAAQHGDDEQARRAKETRDRFDGTVIRNQFNGLRSQQCIVTLSLIPAGPSQTRLDLAEIADQHADDLQPVADRGRLEFKGRSITFSASGQTGIYAVTEFDQTGIILAAHGVLIPPLSAGKDYPSVALPPDSASFIPSGIFERDLIRATERYLRVLRAIRVAGPFYIGVSFLRAKGVAMGVGRRNSWASSARLCTENELRFDPAVIGRDADTGSFEVVAGLMKPICDRLWREFGFPRSLNFEGPRWTGNSP